MKNLLVDLAFPFLEKAAREELEAAGTIRLYKKGEMLASINEPIENTFFILNGFVKVYREDAGGSKFVLFYLHTGHSFGVSLMMPSLESKNISVASFMAAENTYILLVSFENKDRLTKKYDTLYKYVLETAVMHYGFYNNLIGSMAFEQLDVRIEYFLSRLGEAKNKNILKITHKEIADGLNVSREAVSRLLKKMQESDKIIMGRNTIEIKKLLT
jgi:CRP/FNR family transcriptional regulator, anaerobic regulatory protein